MRARYKEEILNIPENQWKNEHKTGQESVSLIKLSGFEIDSSIMTEDSVTISGNGTTITENKLRIAALTEDYDKVSIKLTSNEYSNVGETIIIKSGDKEVGSVTKDSSGGFEPFVPTPPPTSIDLAMVDVNGETQAKMETANCYVVKEAGTYKIPLVYGNAIKNDMVNSAAYTQVAPESSNTQPFYNYKNVQITSPYIETDTNTQAASGAVLYSDVSGYNLSDIQIVDGSPCRYVQFKVDSVPTLGGNLMLAVKDSGGQVMWSWHIWAYPSTIGYKSHTNTTGYTYDWMDVDLGWIKAADGSIYGESPYYQWGRKDPMLRYNNKSTTPAIGSWSVTSCATSLAATIQNPNVFNTSGGNYNWWTDNGTVVNFFNYWDASTSTTGNADNTVVKTIYDPCPRGWHVPNGNCFTGCSTSNGGTWNQGWTWDERYFRASGYRYYTSGSVDDFASSGTRWFSSSYSASGAYSLYFDSSNVYPQDRNYRSLGFPVCPLRELN